MGSRGLLQVGAAFGSALLLSGCGGSASRADASGPSPAAAPVPASLTALQRVVLQQGDLPAGWKAEPYKADPKQVAGRKALITCMGALDTDGDKVAEAHSQEFTYTDARIASSAASYRVQSAPDADVAVLRSAKFSSCYERTLRMQLATSLPAGATIESASFQVTPVTGGTPSSLVATGAGTVKVALQGQRVAIYLTVAYLSGPLYEAEVHTTNVGKPVTPSLVRTIVAAVAARAARR